MISKAMTIASDIIKKEIDWNQVETDLKEKLSKLVDNINDNIDVDDLLNDLKIIRR